MTNDSEGDLQEENQSYLEEGLNTISVYLDTLVVRELRINGSFLVTRHFSALKPQKLVLNGIFVM